MLKVINHDSSTSLPRCFVILIRCLLFLNQLLTCVIVKLVLSVSLRLSSSVGYGFSLYALKNYYLLKGVQIRAEGPSSLSNQDQASIYKNRSTGGCAKGGRVPPTLIKGGERGPKSDIYIVLLCCINN